MADTANTFSGLKPILKESYSSGSMKTHTKPGNEISYSDKVSKLATKPNNKRYFSFLKKQLKKK